MKKISRILMTMIFIAIFLVGCGNRNETTYEENTQTNINNVNNTTNQVNSKTVQLYTNADGSASANEVYEYKGELTPQIIGEGLIELTGLKYNFTSEFVGSDLYIDWYMEPGLLSDGDPDRMANYFGENFPDYGTQQWFMMDSLWNTLKNNFAINDVYYTMEDRQELMIPGILTDTDFIPSDTPYMGSDFYLAHDDVIGDMDTDTTIDITENSEDWAVVSGSYYREGGDQYNAASFQIKPLNGEFPNKYLIEFDVMEGNEQSGTFEYVESYILYVNENNLGVYESGPDEDYLYIELSLEDGAQQLYVYTTGTIPVTMDGYYTFSNEGVEFSAGAGCRVIESLSPAATSLNSYNYPWGFGYCEYAYDGGAHEIEAFNLNTKDIIATFLMVPDLSEIYRLDTGGDAELIYQGY